MSDNERDTEEEEEYTVEKVLDKRITASGVVEYFIKWLEFDDEENTWELAYYLNPELIAAFERELEEKNKGSNGEPSQKRGRGRPRKKVRQSWLNTRERTSEETRECQENVLVREDGVVKKENSVDSTGTTDSFSCKKGFERGLEPEKIEEETEVGGEMMFLIKWKGSDEMDLVPSKLANVKCPQLVLNYLEQENLRHADACRTKDDDEVLDCRL